MGELECAWVGTGVGQVWDVFQIISTFLNSYIFDPIESIKTNQLNSWELVGLGWNLWMKISYIVKYAYFPYITHTYSFIVQDKNAIKMFSIIKRIEIVLNVFERYNYKRKIRYICTHIDNVNSSKKEIIHLKKNIMKKSKTFLEMKII